MLVRTCMERFVLEASRQSSRTKSAAHRRQKEKDEKRQRKHTRPCLFLAGASRAQPLINCNEEHYMEIMPCKIMRNANANAHR